MNKQEIFKAYQAKQRRIQETRNMAFNHKVVNRFNVFSVERVVRLLVVSAGLILSVKALVFLVSL